MFEISLIGTSAKFKPFKESESEIPSVELVTKLVNKVRGTLLLCHVGIKDGPFGVADGNMHPSKTFPTFFLSSITMTLWEATAPSFSREA